MRVRVQEQNARVVVRVADGVDVGVADGVMGVRVATNGNANGKDEAV